MRNFTKMYIRVKVLSMAQPPKKEDVLVATILAMGLGDYRLSSHALERMKERNILLSDIKEAIYNGSREEQKDAFNPDTGDWKYAIRGKNDDGDKDIRMIVAFKTPLVLIITVIDVNL